MLKEIMQGSIALWGWDMDECNDLFTHNFDILIFLDSTVPIYLQKQHIAVKVSNEHAKNLYTSVDKR